MGLKNTFISLALCATTSLSSFQSNSKEFINYLENNKIQIENSAKQRDFNKIAQLVNIALESTVQFNDNVIAISNNYINNWIREDSIKVGEYLATITLHIDQKKQFYKELYKRRKDFSFNKQTTQNINEIISLTDTMRKQIQIYINLAYKGINAKNTFKALKTICETKNNYTLDNYWYSDDIDNDILFVTSNSINEENIEEVFNLEDELTNELQELRKLKDNMPNIKLPDIAGFNFGKLSKNHFKNVSFM